MRPYAALFDYDQFFTLMSFSVMLASICAQSLYLDLHVLHLLMPTLGKMYKILNL
jgi:hypothetical protein